MAKIIQISTDLKDNGFTTVTALDIDGLIYQYDGFEGMWKTIPLPS